MASETVSDAVHTRNPTCEDAPPRADGLADSLPIDQSVVARSAARPAMPEPIGTPSEASGGRSNTCPVVRRRGFKKESLFLTLAFGVAVWPNTAAAQVTPASAVASEREPDTFAWRGRPTLTLGRDSHVELRARVQSDIALHDGAVDPSSSNEPGDRLAWPRRRLGITGTLAGRVDFQVEREVGRAHPWRDVYADLTITRALHIRVGQFKAPFSREQLTSAYDLDFANRSAAVKDLVPLREIGVLVHGTVANRALAYEIGSFKATGDHVVLTADGRSTWTARFNVLPLRKGRRRGSKDLQISAAWRHSPLAAGRTSASGHLAMGARFFAPLNAQGNRAAFDLGAAWKRSTVEVTGEVMRSTDTRRGQALDGGALSDLIAHGGYAAVVWHLYGAAGSRGRAPARAIDIAGRIDWLQFGSGDTTGPPLLSPRANHVAPLGSRTATLGTTWHVNRWMRVQVNGVRESLVDPYQIYPVTRTPVWSAVVRSQVAM